MVDTPDYAAHISHPAQWGLTPGRHCLEGWFVAKPGRLFHDLRFWVDDACHLGVLGYPRPDLEAQFGPGPDRLFSGFQIEFTVWPGASRVRLEALTDDYRWIEVWRSDLLVLGAPVTAPRPVVPGLALPRIYEAILKEHAARPLVPVEELADRHIAASAAFTMIRHPAEPFHGFIDHPAIVAPSQFDRVTLDGWLFHPSQRIVRLIGSAGGGSYSHIEHGGPRPDVGARFPSLPLAASSQFFGHADCDARAPNPMLVRTWAELEDRSLHLVFARRFYRRSTTEAEAFWPPADRKLFARVTRAIHDACTRHRVDPPTGLEGSRALHLAEKAFLDRPRYATPRRPRRERPADPAHPRILLITHNLQLEGAPLFLAEYAAWMRREAGCAVTVLSGAEGPLRARYEALGVEVRLTDARPLAAPDSPAKFQAALRALASSVADVPCDIVVANTLVCFWGILLAAALRRPSLLYIHESATVPRFFFEKLPDRCLGLVDAALNLADQVCFLTPTTRACYELHHRSDNFRLVRSWIQLSAIRAFRAAHARAALRRKHGIPADALVIALIGTVVERKGQQVFARAAGLLRHRHPDLYARSVFLMVGGRPTKFQTGLERDLAWTGLAERVRIVGETHDVYDYYGLADLFVCASFEESFPRVVLEAMAFELPVVSTDVHGIPEIVRDGVEALLVPAGSPSALADAIASALRDPAATSARAARALARVEERFAYEKVLPAHVDLLRGTAGDTAVTGS